MLHFKDFLPSEQPDGATNRVFISATTNIAAVIDGVSGCDYPDMAANICRESLDLLGNDLSSMPLEDILLGIHNKMLSITTKRLMAVCALVRARERFYDVAIVGNLSLIEFNGRLNGQIKTQVSSQSASALGQNGIPHIQKFTVPIPLDGYFILASGGLAPKQLSQTLTGNTAPATNHEWQELANMTSVNPDWSFIVFPFERLSQHDRSNWPYNPFIGPQEGLDHERRGLAEIADVLFRSGAFRGFRILGGITPDKARSSYLADGILIVPEGIVLLELKDHFGEVELPLESEAQMRIKRIHGQMSVEPNPVAKLKRVTRVLHGKNWGSEYPLEAWQKKIAAVIFTNTRCKVVGISGDGRTHITPFISGEVMVTLTWQFPTALKNYLSKFPIRFRMKTEQIETLGKKLASFEQKPTNPPNQWVIGHYMFDRNSGRDTGYYTTFSGVSDRNKPVWLKLYPLKALYRGDRSVALQALGREARILQDLPGDPRLERLLDSGEQGDAFYSIIEAVDGPDVETWLLGSPSRLEKLSLLTDLVDLLVLLSDNKVIHRGITPRTILVLKGRPVLTGFDLARLDSVATLMVDARRLFDQQYLPQEVFTGGVLGAAIDSYSFGALAIRILSGEVPFKDYQELHVRRQHPAYWEKITKAMNLAVESLPDIKRFLAADPGSRPTGRELHAIVSKWS